MEKEFLAPGPGSWSLDNTHSSSAFTRYTASVFSHSMPLGFSASSARFGLPLSHLKPEFVNGFMYVQEVPVGGKVDAKGLPPKWLFKLVSSLHPTLRKRFKDAQHSFSNRHWLKDLEDWDQLKQDSIARNTSLQSVDRKQLNNQQLIEHLDDCYSNFKEMISRHHLYTVSVFLPMGWFLDVATRATGLEVAQLMPLLAGSTPISKGVAGDKLVTLAEALKEANISKSDLVSVSTEEALSLVRNSSVKVVEALDDYLDLTGHMLIGGYCIAEKTLHESPNILLARILEALEPQNNTASNGEFENSVRAKVAEEFKEEFDRSLADARLTSRMRDERGIYNDIWGSGISRTAILAAGQRLVEQGVLTDPELLLDASHEEMLALLDGDGSLSQQELEGRRHWRLNKTIDSVPEQLGMAPVGPPPVDWFPQDVQPAMRAMAIALENLFDAKRVGDSEKITGLPVSPGVYEGTAKVIISTQEFDRLEEGDILVTKNTSAGFNVVLPIIGALVTDRGGVLSHAAIVSREYGIPGVVSTKKATKTIQDGDRIRVDGDNGEVTILS
jgi:pyruvate,water dikinase